MLNATEDELHVNFEFGAELFRFFFYFVYQLLGYCARRP